MRSLLARHWIDALVIGLAVAAQAETWTDPTQVPRLVTVPAALLWTLPLLARRRHPLGAPATVFVTLAVESLLPGQVVTSNQADVFALLLAFAVAGTHASHRSALAGGAVGFLAVAAIVLNEVPDSRNAVPIFVLGAGVWAIARIIVETRRRAFELEDRARRLEREHANAVLAERAGIARELHDVLAHSVSVMTVQAGAARMLLDEDPARAREPLAAVEETGRQALDELRRLLGMLRGTGEASRAPQPGLAQIDDLAEQMRRAGLPVQVHVEGTASDLSPGIDLTAYRVVQEALTNVLKHAGAARARVSIHYSPEALELQVDNHGSVDDDCHDGNGLIGMRQRVELYGGQLEAGPVDGGYQVHAKIPLAVVRT